MTTLSDLELDERGARQVLEWGLRRQAVALNYRMFLLRSRLYGLRCATFIAQRRGVS